MIGMKDAAITYTAVCKIVDSCKEEISSCKDDSQALRVYLGLPDGPPLSPKDVSDNLYNKIRASFNAGSTEIWWQCTDMCKEAINAYILDGKPLRPYHRVIETIRDAIRSVENRPEEALKADWMEAIAHAVDHVHYQDWQYQDEENEPHLYPLFHVARAAQRVQSLGYKLIRSDGKIYFEGESEIKLLERLENIIIQMGGINVTRRIFKNLEVLYNKTQERYNSRLSIPTDSKVRIPPYPPFGYLLQLAAKHPQGKKPLKNTDENWRQLLSLSTDYAAVLDVQNYSPFAWMPVDPPKLMTHLQETAVQDMLFYFQQMRGSDVEALARGCLDGLDFNKTYGTGWTINEVLSVSRAILSSAINARGPLITSLKRIEEICIPLSSTAISRVINDVLCHPPEGANRNFLKPVLEKSDGIRELGLAEHDFLFRPLLQIDSKTYVLLDRSVCAYAFIEALFSALRPEITNFDDEQVGPALERFLKEQFSAKGIDVLSGHYFFGGKRMECDLVIETEQTVIFLEIKKKALTRKARTGSDLYLLIDLMNSAFAAHIQTGQHEVILRREGSIELFDNGTSRQLILGDRNIERIAVSLFDFGGFQDRTFLTQLLDASRSINHYSVPDERHKVVIDELNELLLKLHDQVKELDQYEKDDGPYRPFFHCWFLSISQLMLMLDDVRDANAFRSELWQTRHIHTGSSDFYHDYAFIKKLRAQAGKNAL